MHYSPQEPVPDSPAGTSTGSPGGLLGERAFTLLEMMLSVAVLSLLLVSAFTLVGATIELMSEISGSQREAAKRLRFVETCRAAFESVTDGSTVEFDYVDRGAGSYDTYLSFVEMPGAFDAGFNRLDDYERVILAAEIQPSGFIRSRLYYLTADEFRRTRESDFTRFEGPSVDLLAEMRQLRWRFYDSRAREWRDTLEGDADTHLIELTARTSGSAPLLRSVFWMPAGE